MEQLQVTHWAKNISYEIQNINGNDYVVPTEYNTIYNPIKVEQELLNDALNLGKYLTENELGQNERILDFVHEYGLLGIMPDIADSDIGQNERVIVHENIFTEHGVKNITDIEKMFFPIDNVDLLEPKYQSAKRRLYYRSPVYTAMFLWGVKYAEPLDWIKRYFKYLYSFMLNDESKLEEFNPPRLSYKIDNRNGLHLLCEYDSLKAIIDFAFAKAVTDAKKPLRSCKHCKKMFYANDVRSEFCSPRCRNQYNVYKSRAKHCLK